MKCALVDTNFLMIPGKFKVDVFAELARLDYKPLLLSCVFSELTKLASNRGNVGGHAIVALVRIDMKRPGMAEARGPADRALLIHAEKDGCAIATNDMGLIAKAKMRGITILRLRQRRYIVEE